jgi:hypothetical protein
LQFGTVALVAALSFGLNEPTPQSYLGQVLGPLLPRELRTGSCNLCRAAAQ